MVHNPIVQAGSPTDSRDSKNFRAVNEIPSSWCYFFYSGIQRYSHWSNQGTGYTLKKNSRLLLDKEIFFTHKAKLCLLICIKCIVIYHKMEGEGLPSKRSFLRLVANETKKYLFEGSPSPCILSPLNQLVCLLAPSKRSFRRLVANETKNYPFEGSPSPLQTGGIPSKKSSRRLVDNEIFLTP